MSACSDLASLRSLHWHSLWPRGVLIGDDDDDEDDEELNAQEAIAGVSNRRRETSVATSSSSSLQPAVHCTDECPGLDRDGAAADGCEPFSKPP